MSRVPTYTAEEIKSMMENFPMDKESAQLLVDLVEEELPLYPPEDMPTLIQASMIFFTRALLLGSMRRL